MPLPYLYPYDPSGVAITNKIINELHVVTEPVDEQDANFIVPLAAPFFAISMVIRTGVNITDPVLEEGVDYEFTHPFLEATWALNKLIYGSIMFLDRSYTGNVYITYQTLGGAYTLDDYGIVTSLTQSLYNLRLVTWTQITGLPLNFPPLPHHHHEADMIGLAEVVDKLNDIYLVMQGSAANLSTLSNAFDQHLNGVNSHTKAQVGLHLVPNYRKANQNDLEIQSDVTLMTPKQTLKMLVMYGGATGEGLALDDENKVDKTTTITGGGLVTGGGDLSANRVLTVIKATLADVVGAINDTHALTVASAGHLIERLRGAMFPPLDDDLVLIDDIDLVLRPGTYYLTSDYLNDPVNDGKIPKWVRDESPWGALLEVRAFENSADSDNVVLQQRLIGYGNGETLVQNDYYRSGDDTGGAWNDWVAIHPSNYPVGRVTIQVDGATVVVTNDDNIDDVTLEADNFTGNVYSADPIDHVVTVTFKEELTSANYAVTGTVTGPTIDAVYNIMPVDKQTGSFSFAVVGLNNYDNGSNTFTSTAFKADLVFTGVAALAEIS